GSNTVYVYNSHYKAGTTAADESDRQAEAAGIRANADALGNANIIYAGDYNIQSSNEASFQTLLGAGNGLAVDPVNQLGSWHNSPQNFLPWLTQAPAVSPPGGLTGGGLDDRFDFQMVTEEVLDKTGFDYRPGTYHSFGNNGSVP